MLTQILGAHPIELDSFDYLSVAYPQLLADGPGGQAVVSGDHDRSYARHLADSYRLRNLLSRWVHHAGQAGEDQPGLYAIHFNRVVVRYGLPGEGQDPEGVLCHIVCVCQDRSSILLRQGLRPIGGRGLCAVAQHHLWSAFHGDYIALFMNLVHSGHPHALGVKGILNEPAAAIFYLIENPCFFGCHDKRSLRRIAHHPPAAIGPLYGRVVGMHSNLENPRQVLFCGLELCSLGYELAGWIVSCPRDLDLSVGADLTKGHLSCGQSTGLIGADHRGRAQGLHFGKPSDDGVLLCHGLGSKGQGQCDYEGKGFRDAGYCQSDGGDEGIYDRQPPAEHEDEDDRRYHHH